MNKSIAIYASNYDAVIFDMDGTMVDNAQAHKLAWQQFLKIHKISLSDEEFTQKLSGKKNDQILSEVFEGTLSPALLKRLANEKEALYRKIYKPDLQEVPGLKRMIWSLKDAGLKLAIATTAPKLNRDLVLQSLGLESEFTTIMGDEHVINGKPHPEIYVKTAAQLGVAANRCLVFEDSPPGVKAAKTAGMTVAAILVHHTRGEVVEADFFAVDFNGFNVK